MPRLSRPRPDVLSAVLARLVAVASLPLLAAGSVAAAELPAVAPAGLIQWGCVQMVITPCVCPGWPPRPCVHFSYWEPTLLVHTEAYTGLSRSATDARFHEARVWPFPLKEVDPLGCIFPCKSPNRTLSVFAMIPYFLSDIDPTWRRGDTTLPYPVGVWGLLSPRGGWGAGSDPVASAIAFYRSVDVAALPGAHAIIRPSFVPASLANNVNLGFPKLSQCMKPGFPPILWESGAGSATGNYLWVWYQHRTCCIDPAEICTSVALRDPQLTIACARIDESAPGASPPLRPDLRSIGLRPAG
jgi:hypothetical protein